MKLISLFSGIGGFELAAEWMGWEPIVSCEINPFGRKALEYYWPNAYHHDDIHTLTADLIRQKIGNFDANDIILTGGFPCQPYSSAGKRLGKDDERHLWPEMLRIIREVQPKWIVGENVFGLVNWNGGMVFEEVQADLEAQGYEVQAYVLPACAVDAPHRRDRVWFVAHRSGNTVFRDVAHSTRCNDRRIERELPKTKCRQELNDLSAFSKSGDGLCSEGISSNTLSCGCGRITKTTGNNNAEQFGRMDANSGRDGREIRCKASGYSVFTSDTNRKRYEEQQSSSFSNRPERFFSKNNPFGQPKGWNNFPTQRPVCLRDDGFSSKLPIFVVKEFYETISYTSQKNRIENLPEMWDKVQSPEVWEAIRGLYALESKEVLFQTMQLYQTGNKREIQLSPFSEEVSQRFMPTLRKYGEFTSSPRGQELEKQRENEFGNALRFLPHEIPLASRAFETAITKFKAWHRNESIKAYGNAIVPQVALQIFKAIQQYEDLNR